MKTTAEPAAYPLLNKLAIGLIALTIVLRITSGGLLTREPETALLGVLIALAGVARLGGQLTAEQPLYLPRPRILIGLAAFLIPCILAWMQGVTLGQPQLSSDLGMVWALDLLLFLLIVDTARPRPVLRLYLCCLLGGLCISGIYGLYQRWYMLPYFRHLVEAAPEMRALAPQGDAELLSAFNNRINSDRIFGVFAYPNVLAGYALMLLPMLGWLRGRDDHKRDWLRIGLLAIGCFLIVYSRSKAGLLTAKGIEVAALCIILPAAMRSWRNVFQITGRVVLASVGCAGIAALVYLLTSATDSAFHFADTTFALCWIVEICLLVRWCKQQASSPRAWPGIAGAALLLLLLSGTLAFLITPAATLPARAQHLQQEAHKTLNVRAQYWQAALDMAADYPLRGVGLDQYQSYYSLYKTPTGWETRRTHNLYLQLLTDGGVPLLTGFVLLLILLFLPRRDPPEADTTTSASSDPHTDNPALTQFCRKSGSWIGVGALMLSYYLFMTGMGTGFSLEFFFKEFFGGPQSGSLRMSTGSVLPLFIHGGVHLLLLPLGYWIVARLVWARTADLEPTALIPWLKLALIAVLVHSLFDFHFHADVISMLWWLLAGLLIAHSAQGTVEVRFSKLGKAILVLTLLVLFPLQHLFAIWQASAAEEAWQNFRINRKPTAQQYTNAVTLLDDALTKRPTDTDLLRLRVAQAHYRLAQYLRRGITPRTNPTIAQLRRQNRLRRPSVEIAAARKAVIDAHKQEIAARPHSAGIRFGLAKVLLDLYPQDKEKSAEALALYNEAVERYPYQPQYRLGYAQHLLREGHREQARTQALEADRISQIITDRRAMLTAQEKTALDILLRNLASQRSE